MEPLDHLLGVVLEPIGHGWSNENLEVPIEYQLGLLGLGRKLPERSERLRGLDIGCGRGALVEHLIGQGLDAEGIDRWVEGEAPYLMKQWVTSLSPAQGCIPRPNDSYDFATAFQNTTLNLGLRFKKEDFRDKKFDEKKYEDASRHAQAVIYDTVRVLKPGKGFIIYPELERLDEVMGPFLRMSGISAKTERVETGPLGSYLDWEADQLEIPRGSIALDRWEKRTVLTKE